MADKRRIMTTKYDSPLSVAEIARECDMAGINVRDFWTAAMGGDMAPLPRADVARIIAVLTEPDPCAP